MKEIARLFGSFRYSQFFLTRGSIAWLSLSRPQVFYERHDLSRALSVRRQGIHICSLDDDLASPFRRVMASVKAYKLKVEEEFGVCHSILDKHRNFEG